MPGLPPTDNDGSRISTSRPVREFGLKAMLWLPLSFVLWFRFGAVLVWPPMLLAKAVLLRGWGALFENLVLGGERLDDAGRVVQRADYLLTLSTRVTVQVPAGPDGPGGIGVLEPTLNPMVYAYSLPLFVGLAMATPLSTRRRLAQIAIALAAIWLGQAFGIVAESLKVLASDAGSAGAAAVAAAGVHREAVAFAYQFATLIVPAVMPVVLWIGLNRAFIEDLVGWRGNPDPAARV